MKTIKTKQDFDKVKKNNSSWGSHSLVLLMGNEEKEEMRVGYIVTKKVGNAVVRNRIKRRLKVAVKEVMTDVPNRDYIIIGKIKAFDCPFGDIKRDLRYCLGKIRK